jgi:hypothetical protein
MSTTPAPFATVQKYLDLLTSEHQDLPLFSAFLTIFLQGQVDLQNFLASLPAAFDVDTAIGVQLDAVGVRVGRSRSFPAPITGVYFSWDIAGVGWDEGVWQGPFDPDTGIQYLPDEFYRTILKAKIAANQWDGTVVGAEAMWTIAFGPDVLVLQDNQNMTETMRWVGAMPDSVTQILLGLGYFTLKPAGVALTGIVLPGGTVITAKSQPK